MINNSLVRQIKAKAELFSSSAASATGCSSLTLNNVYPASKVDIKLESRNLFDKNNAQIFNGWIPQAGTTVLNSAATTKSVYIPCKPNTIYTVSKMSSARFGIAFAADVPAASIQLYNAVTNNNATSLSSTAPEDAKYLIAWVYHQNYDTSISLEDILNSLQIEVGAAATAYKEYTTDFTDYKVKVSGKNLVDMKNPNLFPTGGRFEIIDDNTVRNYGCAGFGNAELSYSIYAPAGTKITISYEYELGGVATGTWFIVQPLDWMFKSGSTMTVPEQGYLKFGFIRSGGGANDFNGWVDIKNLQVEVAAAPTDYEPYNTSAEYTTGADGTITIPSISPNTTILADANITANYTIGKTTIYTSDDNIKEITLDRIGEESKFFGFGISQKINLKLLDMYRQISPDKTIKISFDDNTAHFPAFNVTEINRDENTNELSITAYDALNDAAAHTVSELNLSAYTIGEFAAACATILGLTIDIKVEDESFNTWYENGANFEGTETIRAALNAVAEATQTIYYIDGSKLVFKRLGGQADYIIDKSKYITLKSGDNRRLSAICSATELGDNVEAALTITGTTQYIRDNPFWELREDIAELVDKALAAVGGMTINQFNCNWIGDYSLKCGDTIELITKDDDIVKSYLINDSIKYSGAFSEVTQWSYTSSDTDSYNNPTSLGEALTQTFAKVDKQNKQIEIVASETTENKEAISALTIDTNSINAAITDIETEIAETGETISTLKQQVEAQITEEEIVIKIQQELADGVSSVTTGKGYTLNDEGFTVEDINPDTNNEIKTTISNNGMTVYSNNNEKLQANDEGVIAVDLHAKTYLIVGDNSRFENYGYNRTGCFWIGG